MPREIGAAMSRASTDEYSVPQMNGRAPNCAGDRIPHVGDPEVKTEFANRKNRFAEQDEPDRHDDGEDESAESSRHRLESDIACRSSLYLDPIQLLELHGDQRVGEPCVAERLGHRLAV